MKTLAVMLFAIAVMTSIGAAAAAQGSSGSGLSAVRPAGRLLAGKRVLWMPPDETESPAHVPEDLAIGCSLRTGAWGWAVGEFRDLTSFEMIDLTRLSLNPGTNDPTKFSVQLDEGSLYIAHRGKARAVTISTPYGEGDALGTEYVIRVDPVRREASFLMLDGTVELRQGAEVERVQRGEVGVASPAGIRVQPIEATKVVQWWIHYPVVVDPAELPITDPQLKGSLEAYRQGDIAGAIDRFPGNIASTVVADDAATVLQCALLLAAGSPAAVVSHQERLPQDAPTVSALRELIQAVAEPLSSEAAPNPVAPGATAPPRTASEWLARSYRHQADRDLTRALDAARRAVEQSPGFGMGWARLAELEFSRGDLRAARLAVEKALALSPAYAPARTMQGFLLAAQNRVALAETVFDDVIRSQPRFADAWLGRGLCRIRRGRLAEGREDLRAAAALEPRRSLLRSYAGKALDDGGETVLAEKELALASELDPKDPVPPLYSALHHQRGNRINEAVDDLRRSLELNDHRAVYRSPFLLDQDRAVRGANLANVYTDAGLAEVGLREATRGLNADYANASAHLFLANSYNALRDPRQVNLRHEAAWFSEFLLANLLAPVGAGTLSQNVSQGEYSKLFERDRLGVVSETLWTSNGDWMESGTQFGLSGNVEYALDALYRSEVGQRPNNDLEQLTLSFTGKAQLSLADTVLIQGIYYDASSGDVAQYYDPKEANPVARLHETQEPIVLAGWHHEWQPGVHTLLLVSPWNVKGTINDPTYESPTVYADANGSIRFWPDPYPFDPQPLDYATRYTGVSAELQQLWQLPAHTLIGGIRYQIGEFDTDATLEVGPIFGAPGESIVRDYGASPGMDRFSLYAYDQWQVLPWVLLTAGVSYDSLTAPVNFTRAPLTDYTDTLDQVSPKVGVTLAPWKDGTVRAAYTRSLDGVSFDQSYRLEPVQVAGFTQTWRGLMPESLVGLVPGQEIETFGVGLEQRFSTRTYVTLAAERLRSEATRGVGAFLFEPYPEPHTLSQSLGFDERSLRTTVHQLLGDKLALTAGYRLSEATLDAAMTGVEDSAQHQHSVLQQLDLGARFNLSCGFFARWDSIWTHQSNSADVSDLAGDDFWQHNLWVGWRFHRRHAEIAVGVLNITDEDYRLYPLNNYSDTYRDRTFAMSARFNF